MDNLVLNGTLTTPNINFNFSTGELFISGESYPENASEFFEKVISWIKNYIAFSNPITLNFQFNYFNTSTSKAIMDIFEILDEYHRNNGKVMVNWYYESDDEDIYESGMEFIDNLSLPYKMIEIKS